MRRVFIPLLLVTCGLMIGCSTAPKSAYTRDTLRADADNSLARFHEVDPSTRDFLNGAHGYAIFPKVGKGGAIAGGAYGRGTLYEKGAFVGYCDMTQATVGAQLGGQTFSELIVFETAEALNRFKSGTFALAANASAVVAKNGAAKTARYSDGVAVFVDPNAGLMAEAAVGGQQFKFVPEDQAATPREWKDTTVKTDMD
jgi:lipid-binding SYLF domain-containing protein